MNSFLMFLGTTLAVIFLLLLVTPEYRKLRPDEKFEYKNQEDYEIKVWIISILISVMINSLIWGLIW